MTTNVPENPASSRAPKENANPMAIDPKQRTNFRTPPDRGGNRQQPAGARSGRPTRQMSCQRHRTFQLLIRCLHSVRLHVTGQHTAAIEPLDNRS